MRIWRKGGNHTRKNYQVMVQPGNFHPGVSDFMNEDGTAKMFCVDFIYGRTEELPDNLARFIIDQGLAQETAIILAD